MPERRRRDRVPPRAEAPTTLRGRAQNFVRGSLDRNPDQLGASTLRRWAGGSPEQATAPQQAAVDYSGDVPSGHQLQQNPEAPEQGTSVLRSIAREVIPREGAGATIGNSLMAMPMSAAGTAGNAIRGGTGFLSQRAGAVAPFAQGYTGAIPTTYGFRNAAQLNQGARDLTRTLGMRSGIDMAKGLGTAAVLGGGGALVASDLAKEGPGADPYTAPERAPATGSGDSMPNVPGGQVVPGGGGAERPRDLQSLLRRMESGETLRQDDFDQAGFTGEGLDTVPAGVSPFGGGAGSLRDLTMEQRGQIYNERERRARFEGGDLSAARPGDLRQLRRAFGANTEDALRSEFTGTDGRMGEIRRTPEERERQAAALAEARAADSQTLREGFEAQQNRGLAQQELGIRQQEADTNRLSTMLQGTQEGQLTLEDAISGGLTPERVNQLGETTLAELRGMFGDIPEGMERDIMGLSQGYLRRAMQTSQQRFGGNPTAEQLAGHVQDYQDLFTAGMGILFSAQSSAAGNQGFIRTMQNAFQEGGGARARRELGILRPDNPVETMEIIEGLAQTLQDYDAGVDNPNIVRGGLRTAGRGKLHDEITVRDPQSGEILQTIDMREIPQELRAKIKRAHQGS